MSRTLRRKPGYYGRPLYERQAWKRFGRRRFPNYDSFWQAFVVPLIRPKPYYIKYLEDVTPEQRQIIRLHQRIFRLFYSVYVSKPYSHEPADWFEGRHFLSRLYRLTTICDHFEELLLLISISPKTTKYQAVAEQISSYYKATKALKSFTADFPMTVYDPTPSLTEDDAAELKKILGDYGSVHELITDQADKLLVIINDIYGDRLVPLVEEQATG